MANAEWILCEQSSRWVAALRTYFHRRQSFQRPPRIIETRRLGDVAPHLRTHPTRVVLLEVDLDRLASLLNWLTETAAQYPDVRFAALLDRHWTITPQQRDIVVVALQEAGACEVAVSPRRIEAIVALAQNHSITATSSAKSDDLPLRDWAWSRLPWQAVQGRVR
jgi:hypothetical protein